jgi:major vault protein
MFLQEAELERLTSARQAEMKYVSEQNSMEVKKSKEITAIETEKFQQMVGALGTETLRAIATSSTDNQV